MKNKNHQPGTAILGIKSHVLFRAAHFPKTRSANRIGVQIKDLNDGSVYEFKGQAAYLWLLLDGVRSIDGAIQRCQRSLNIKDPQFSKVARHLLEDLFKINLLVELPSKGKKDNRARDMEKFLGLFKKRTAKNGKLKAKVIDLNLKNKSSDRAELLEVHDWFSKLFKNRARLKLSRRPSAGGGLIPIFASEFSWPGVEKGYLGFGAGLTVRESAMAAVGEAIERHCFLQYRPDIYSKSHDELAHSKHHVLDPDSFKIYSLDQDSLRNHEVVNPSRKTKAHWSLFEDAICPGQKILLPRVLSAPGRSKENLQLPILYEGSSNGWAAHTDPNTAKLGATLEIIERDNVLFYWRTKNSPAQIDLSQSNNKIAMLLERLGSLKKRIRLFYLKSELSTVTVQAVLLGKHALGEPHFVSTSATRLNVTEAIEKSLIELLYVLQGFKESHGHQLHFSYGKNFDNSVWDFEDRLHLYGSNKLPEAYKFLFPKNPTMISATDIPGLESGDSKKSLETLISEFNLQRLRLYFRDCTTRNVRSGGFWVYRAFSPDLISFDAHHRFRTLGLPRYYKLPAALGLKKKPNNASQLSSWPHPIP